MANCFLILKYYAHLILLTFIFQCLLMHRIILESDANVIAGRVAMRGAEADVPLSEQVTSFTDFITTSNDAVVIIAVRVIAHLIRVGSLQWKWIFSDSVQFYPSFQVLFGMFLSSNVCVSFKVSVLFADNLSSTCNS